jgi:hypothetical protein
MSHHLNAAVKQTSGFLKRGLAALTILASPAALYAQGCAMCYQSAAASGPRGIQALKSGILILIFPPVLITTAIAYLAYKKRNKFNST